MSLKLYHFKFTAYTKNNIVFPGYASQLAGSRERARELVKIEFKKLNIRLKDLEDWEG